MRLRFAFVVAGLVLLLASGAIAQIPQMINYQGKITGSSGACLDTTVQMVFSIYVDGYTTTYLWRETQPEVPVEKGVFSVNLGSYTPIPISVFDGSVKFLGVKVGGDAEMSPRKQITSTGYAFRSQNTDVWDTHHWGDTYPTASSALSADAWDGHHWGDAYPNSDVWDGHHWGDTYPYAANSGTWSGHSWGETYPSASSSDLVDGLHGSQFLRSDVSSNINGNLGIVGTNYVNFYAGSAERIRYDAGLLSPYHGMLFLCHPTRRFIFGLLNDGGGYGGTLMTIPAKGPVNISAGLEVTGDVRASSFQEVSDMRLKTKVEALEGALERVSKLRGVSFEWNDLHKSTGGSAGNRQIGVVAQEVEAVFPELVTTWGDEQYRAVDYGRLTAVLIEAVKELKAENASLKERIEKLEGKQ